jgi:aerobic-type carbon monoxide dehydrogenase small subunit (CoxS/CutS family)
MIRLKVNGQAKEYRSDPEMPLLWYLRSLRTALPRFTAQAAQVSLS